MGTCLGHYGITPVCIVKYSGGLAFSLFLLVEVSCLKLGWHDESLMASSFLIDLYFSLCSKNVPDISIKAILTSGEYNNIHQKCQS